MYSHLISFQKKKKTTFFSQFCSCTIDISDQNQCVVLPCIKFELWEFFLNFCHFYLSLTLAQEKKVTVFLVCTGDGVKS